MAVYILEVHPKDGMNPYMGEAINAAEDPFAIATQPTTAEERTALAQNFTAAFDGVYAGLFDTILIDDVTNAAGEFNPTWAAYGATPNGGWLIGQDGTVKLAQMFICHVGMPMVPVDEGEAAIGAAIDELLAPPPAVAEA